MPTRRVRQVERKGQPERRREFVQDVTANADPEKNPEKSAEKFFVAKAE
jgi:hypothetical protein